MQSDLCALAKKTNDIALSLVVQNADEECNINNNAGKNNAISLVMQYFFGEYNVCFWWFIQKILIVLWKIHAYFTKKIRHFCDK